MGKLRERMPIIDAFIDDLRAAFGREAIDRAIHAGLRDGSFHAIEGDEEVGAPLAPDGGVRLANMAPWNDRARGDAFHMEQLEDRP